MPEFKSKEKRSGNSQPLRWAVKRDSYSDHGNKTYPESISGSGSHTDPTKICKKNNSSGKAEAGQLAATCTYHKLRPYSRKKGEKGDVSNKLPLATSSSAVM